MIQIDNMVGNPPFQDRQSRGKTQHKLWIDFTKTAIDELLKPNGQIGWLTPSSFSSPSNKILDYFKKHSTNYINFDTNDYFDDENNSVGINMAHYVIRKNDDILKATKVVSNTNEFLVNLNNDLFYIPNDISDESISIHQKTFLSKNDKYPIYYDYVTCHNVLLNRIKVDCPISKEKTSKHIYPIFHTNSQTWYSSVEQMCYSKKKVMWTRSGFQKPFYNNGNLGMTDMAYCIFVDTDEIGENLAHNLNQKLFQYLFKTAKWSGFGNEKVFRLIPTLPNRQMPDSEIYEYFGITSKEQQYIDDILNNNIEQIKTNIKPILNTTPYEDYARQHYMAGLTRSQTRINNTAEVFTPTSCVQDILNHMDESSFRNNETFLDNSCGDGQFLVEVVIKKQQMGITLENALKTTYGVDIMPDNIEICRKRLQGPNPTKEIINIVNQNIVCSDSLEYDYSFGQPVGVESFF